MNTWITSDTHFGHKNIIKFCNRPFFSIQDMDEALIKNWNAVVKPEDHVYHLGDFAFRQARQLDHYISQLHGKIFILPGNHDKVGELAAYSSLTSPVRNRWQVLPHIYTYFVQQTREKVELCHYPILAWNARHHGRVHLHGHVHTKNGESKKPGYIYLPNCYDVGVDNNDYKPVLLSEAIAKARSINVQTIEARSSDQP